MSDQPSLTQRSPFLPPGFDPDSKPTEKPRPNRAQANKPLEFRGVYQLLGEFRFLVKERTATFGNWVKLNDSNADFVVKSYDPVAQSVTVEYEGSTQVINLIALEGNPAPIPVNGQPPSITPRVNPTAQAPTRHQIPVRNNNSNTNTNANNNSNNPSLPQNTNSNAVRRPPSPPQFSNNSPSSGPVDSSGAPAAPPSSGPPTNVIIPEVPNFTPPPPPSGPPPTPPPGLFDQTP